MDDIAKELSISKKKLYQIYKDKNELVEKTIQSIKKQMQIILEEYNNSPLNPIEKEIYYRRKYLKTYLTIKPTYVYDLKKFYPKIYNDMMQFKMNQISETTSKFVKEGIKQGLLRENLDEEFISKLSLTLNFALFHPEINFISDEDLTSKHFSDQFFIYHMNGICSEKGRKVFEQIFNNEHH